MNAASRPAKSGLTSGEDANHTERDVGPQAEVGAKATKLRNVSLQVVVVVSLLKSRDAATFQMFGVQKTKNMLSGG